MVSSIIPTPQRNHQAQPSLVGCLSHLIAPAVIFLILFICLGISKCSFQSKEEVEFSAQVQDQDPAYIHVKSIEPEFSVSQRYSMAFSDIVCRCTTTSGETVWVYISTNDYNKYIDSDAQFSSALFGNTFETIYFEKDTIIHGKVRNAEDLCDGLESKTEKTVLLFLYLEEK